MRTLIIGATFLLGMCLASWAVADECLEGDCENGVGTGYTDDNRIYEGEWRQGLPHGSGKLYVGKGKVIEGIWEKGTLVKEEANDPKSEPAANKD